MFYQKKALYYYRVHIIHITVVVFLLGSLFIKLIWNFIKGTPDGDIVNKILRSRNNHEKEYIVTVNKPITNDFIEKIRNGLPILDQITKKCYAEQIHKKQFRIILTQGLNRQIRRMCEYLEYKVLKLKRVRIMNIKLNTKVGRYRDLTKKEMNELLNLISDSEKNFN